MLPKRVMDLPGWPPQSGGSTKPGDIFPISTDDVTIERVILYAHESLMFSCKFNGKSVFYNFPMLDESFAKKLATILNAHIGQKLTSIAFVEIPEDND